MQAANGTPPKATPLYFIILFVCAFLVRALTFGYVQQEERYKQPDSNDYHNGALCIAYGFGMTFPNGEPIFWRVPGYSAYLAPFYAHYGITDTSFSGASDAQQASIWMQIVLSAFLPLILFFLALLLTQSYWIAHITAWLSVIHLGFALASTYILTEGIALVPFYLFLLFFYRSFRSFFETKPASNAWIKNIIAAALFLVLHTWVRPMGQYIAVVAALILLLFAQDTFKRKAQKIALFLCVFASGISPWYIRNYNLTGQWFFCPMFGTYLKSFTAPRIMSEIEDIELIDAWKRISMQAAMTFKTQKPLYERDGLALSPDMVCGSISWPIVLAHPFLALRDWMREVIKTTVDLYSSQLVAFVRHTHHYDPLIEYITEKWYDCVYDAPLSWPMRCIVFLEIIYALLLWVGLIGGFIRFMLLPCIRRFNEPEMINRLFGMWIKVAPMIAATLFMTGGFGYARLRLPIEGLMIILSLSFWQYIRKK